MCKINSWPISITGQKFVTDIFYSFIFWVFFSFILLDFIFLVFFSFSFFAFLFTYSQPIHLRINVMYLRFFLNHSWDVPNHANVVGCSDRLPRSLKSFNFNKDLFIAHIQLYLLVYTTSTYGPDFTCEPCSWNYA